MGAASGFTVDVSAGGFCAELMRVFPKGTAVKGTLLVDGQEYEFSGRVAWAKQGDFRLNMRGRMGVTFTDAPEELRRLFGIGPSGNPAPGARRPFRVARPRAARHETPRETTRPPPRTPQGPERGPRHSSGQRSGGDYIPIPPMPPMPPPPPPPPFAVVVLRTLGDHRLGGEHQGGDGGRVLQRGARDLGRVDDAGREQVLVGAGRGVEAERARALLHLVDDDRALHGRRCRRSGGAAPRARGGRCPRRTARPRCRSRPPSALRRGCRPRRRRGRCPPRPRRGWR